MLKLRLTRLGDKKRPSYRLVAMEALSKRDGGAIAYLGNYFPLEAVSYTHLTLPTKLEV